MRIAFFCLSMLIANISYSLTVDEYGKLVDYSCEQNSDCLVKNVGNCCGYEPKCVNVNSFADQKMLVEACAVEEISSGCGYAEVDICECIKGKCVGDSHKNREFQETIKKMHNK